MTTTHPRRLPGERRPSDRREQTPLIDDRELQARIVECLNELGTGVDRARAALAAGNTLRLGNLGRELSNLGATLSRLAR